MAKRKTDKLPERLVPPPADHYPGLQGKVVDWAAHRFEEGGLLFLRVHFTDHTELCWTVRTATVIAEADLCDWKSGDEKQLRKCLRKVKVMTGQIGRFKMQKAHLYEAIHLVNRGIDDAIRGLERLKLGQRCHSLKASYFDEKLTLFETHRALLNGYFCNNMDSSEQWDEARFAKLP